MPPTRGYTATKDELLARLRRVEGQIRGIEGMEAYTVKKFISQA